MSNFASLHGSGALGSMGAIGNQAIPPHPQVYGIEGTYPHLQPSPWNLTTITNMVGTLEPFYGTPFEDVRDWLERFTHIAHANDWSENIWIVQFGSCMMGAAKSWWNSLDRNIREEWQTMRDAFVEEFADRFRHFDYYKLISERVQGKNESALAYCWEMKRLMTKANPDMSERDQLNYLFGGLQPELKKELIKKNPQTWDGAVTIIREEESNLRQISSITQKENVLHMQMKVIEDKIVALENKEKVGTTGVTSTNGEGRTTGTIQMIEEDNRGPRSQFGNSFTRQSVNENKKRFNQWRSRGEFQRKDENFNKRTFRSYRTTDGVPICRFCLKMGHVESVCRTKNGYNRKRRPEEYDNNRKRFKNQSNNVSQVKTNKPDEKYSCLRAEILINNCKVLAIIDTGASASIIQGSFVDTYLADEPINYQRSESLITASGEDLNIRGTIYLQVRIGSQLIKHWFRIVENIHNPVIIGTDILYTLQIQLDLFSDVIKKGEEILTPLIKQEKNIIIGRMSMIENSVLQPQSISLIKVDIKNLMDENKTFQIPSYAINSHCQIQKGVCKASKGKPIMIQVINYGRSPFILYKNQHIGIIQPLEMAEIIATIELSVEDIIKQIDQLDFKLLNDQEDKIAKSLLKEFVDIFARNPKKPPTTIKTKHNVDTGNHPPIKQKAFRVSRKEEDIIRKEISEMQENNIIRKSKSPWASPVVLVTKPDGSTRFCVDYRKLNKITKKDVYPLPRIDETLERMKGMNYYSSIDLASGYWQVEMDEESKEKTAFICNVGLFEFNVMPFGLCNAPATFQRMMDEVIGEAQVGLDYLDDVIIGSETFEKHIKDLKKLFESLRRNRLAMKLNKCKFFQKELIHLGHVLNKDGIKPNPSKIEVIQKIPVPTDIHQLKRFLGLTGYYRKFIKNYARITDPLNKLLKKNTLYKWTELCDKAFNNLKQKLCKSPILAHPNYQLPFKLFTDASTIGLGAVLSQDQDGKEVVISYASRTLSPSERNYTITELECLAIVWAVKHFRPYLYGTKFTVITDHNALRWLMSIQSPSGRLMRWSLKLQEYDMEIEHRPGRIHSNVDPLSRIEVINSIFEKVAILECDVIPKSPILVPFLRKELYHEWKEEQSKEYNGIIEEINKGEEVDQYQLINDILFKYKQKEMNTRRDKYPLRLVVPSKFRKGIIEEHHNNILAGHLGIKKTYMKISSKYYWKGMYQDIATHITTCLDCNMRKGDPSEMIGKYKPIITKKPLELIAVDIVGPLPKSIDGNLYILLFVDHFTRWIEAIPLAKNDAETIARKFIENIICRHGVPEKLLTDCGSNFTAKILEHTMSILTVQHMKTAVYHHQANGMVEKMAKTVEEVLSMYVSNHQRDWDVLLPYVTFAYNTSIHSSTGRTPFILMYG